MFVDSQFMILCYTGNLSDGECVVNVHLVEFVLVDKKKRRLLSIIAPVGWMMVYQGWFLDWFLVLLSIEVKKKAIHNPRKQIKNINKTGPLNHNI